MDTYVNFAVEFIRLQSSVCNDGACYDNALTETSAGQNKTDIVGRWCPWRNIEAVEFSCLSRWTGSTTAAGGAHWKYFVNQSWLSRQCNFKEPKMAA